MKKLLILLLFPCLAASASHAENLGKKPRPKAKHHYEHASGSSTGKGSKARFRRVNNIHPFIDLNPGRLDKFKTTKAPKNWKWTHGV